MSYKSFGLAIGASVLLAGCVGATLDWQYDGESEDGLVFLHTDAQQEHIYHIQDSNNQQASLTILNLSGEALETYPLPDMVSGQDFPVYEYIAADHQDSFYIRNRGVLKLPSGAFIVSKKFRNSITDFYFHDPKSGRTWSDVSGLENYSVDRIYEQPENLLQFEGVGPDGDSFTALVNYDGQVVSMNQSQPIGDSELGEGNCQSLGSVVDSKGNRYAFDEIGIRMCDSDGNVVWERAFNDFQRFGTGTRFLPYEIQALVDVFRINSHDQLEMTRSIRFTGVSGLETEFPVEFFTGEERLDLEFTASQTITVLHQRYAESGVLLGEVKEPNNTRVLLVPYGFGERLRFVIGESDTETTGGCRAQDSLILDNGNEVYATHYCNYKEGYGSNKVSFYSY